VKPQSASVPPTKNKSKAGENGAGRAEAAPQDREAEGDMIAQISTLQQQLHDSHEREKNLQKELMKMQRRMEAAQPKDANIAG
jgi:molecular chaperone GrpE (heat shock protein)